MITILLARPCPHSRRPAPVGECVIYVRISRDTEGAGLGVERQAADCRELATRLGLRVAAVYDDNDVSAYSGKVRKGYRRMLADLAHHPRPVLVWHTDRLHRSPRELEEWIALAEPNGIAVHTVQAGQIDLATPGGRMNARNLGNYARYESEIKSERIKRKMAQKAEHGEWLGGRVPFGWRRIPTDPKRLELAPDEAALIAAGTRTLLSGASMRAVVRDFDASGVPPRASKAWDRRSVRMVLGRWRNAGVHEHRGQVGGPADWPAVPGVSVDDVRAVRALLDERAEGAAYDNRSAWLLSGIAVCACGQPVRVADRATTDPGTRPTVAPPSAVGTWRAGSSRSTHGSAEGGSTTRRSPASSPHCWHAPTSPTATPPARPRAWTCPRCGPSGTGRGPGSTTWPRCSATGT